MHSKLFTACTVVVLGFLIVTNPVVADAAKLVTSKQIKNNTIKSKDIKDKTIEGVDVRDDGLTGADIAEATLVLPAGPTVVKGSTDSANHSLTGGLDTIASVTFVAPSAGVVRVTGKRVLRLVGCCQRVPPELPLPGRHGDPVQLVGRRGQRRHLRPAPGHRRCRASGRRRTHLDAQGR